VTLAAAGDPSHAQTWVWTLTPLAARLTENIPKLNRTDMDVSRLTRALRGMVRQPALQDKPRCWLTIISAHIEWPAPRRPQLNMWCHETHIPNVNVSAQPAGLNY
jgi:hypothetical protein